MKINDFYKKYSFKSVDGAASGLIDLSQEQLNDLHSVLIDIMDDIIGFCAENELTCFLSGGTALGAIRHKGFIPWDDDVDLNITRESYSRFIPLFKEKYSDKYWIHTPEDNPEFGLSICRVRKKGTIVKTREDLIDDSEAGAYVDLFIVENVFDNKILRTIQGILAMITKVCLSCRRYYRDRKIMSQMLEYDQTLQSVSRNRLIIGFLSSFMSVTRWNKINNAVFSMCKNNKSKLVSIPAGKWHFFGEMYKREMFCEMATMSFEGREFPVCKGMDEYMRILYGDNYMVIPPVEKREKHMCWVFDLGGENNE